MTEINICGITYEKSDPEFVKSLLGKPNSIEEQSFNPNIEWGDGFIKLKYESYTFHYLLYDEAFIESIIVKDSTCVIQTTKGSFNVSTKLEKLENLFPESYSYFLKKYSKPYKQDTQKFYVNLFYNKDESSFYGNMILFLEDDIVTKVFLSLVEGN